MKSNTEQLIDIVLYLVGSGVGGLIMYLWGFKLIDKFLDRKNKDSDED